MYASADTIRKMSYNSQSNGYNVRISSPAAGGLTRRFGAGALQDEKGADRMTGARVRASVLRLLLLRWGVSGTLRPNLCALRHRARWSGTISLWSPQRRPLQDVLN
jgi:hypothetical protein